MLKTVYLKEICIFEKGRVSLAKAEPGPYPLVTTGAERKSCNSYQFDTEAVCIPLVSSTGHGHAGINNIHYQEGKFALGSILVALTAKDPKILNIQFLHLYLSQLKNEILVPLMTGAANIALSVQKIQNISIPLPEKRKQNEIVHRFKSIVREDRHLKDELAYQTKLIAELRGKILQDAIEGKLTTNWRLLNTESESASLLLKHISDKNKETVIGSKATKQKFASQAAPVEGSFLLPKGWEWCRFQEAAEISSNLVSPRNYYDLPHIAPNHIEKNTGRLLSYSTAREDKVFSSKHLFYTGQLLYSKVRPQLNKVVLAPCDGLCSADMYPINSCINSSYLQKVMLSHYFINEVNKFDNRVKMPKINQNQLNGILIPCAPLEEQKAIAENVDKLFAICDQLEMLIHHSQLQAGNIMQAVLKEAFTSRIPGLPAPFKRKGKASPRDVEIGHDERTMW